MWDDSGSCDGSVNGGARDDHYSCATLREREYETGD